MPAGRPARRLRHARAFAARLRLAPAAIDSADAVNATCLIAMQLSHSIKN